MQQWGIHAVNLHEVSCTLYNIGRIQLLAERRKGQIRELNNLPKSTQQETDFKPTQNIFVTQKQIEC